MPPRTASTYNRNETMGKKRSPWLIGCGIGCGLVLLLVMIVAGSIAFFVRDVSKPFNSAIEARQDLDRRHGAVHEFVPWTDGAVPADRVEAFLRVRESCAERRRGMEQAFGVFTLSEEEIRDIESKGFLEQMSFAFGMSKQALGLAPELGSFFDARNRALLDTEMGLGEYTYIYVLAYYSWLGHSPGDGPGGGYSEAGSSENGEGAVRDGPREDGGREAAQWSQRRVRRDIVQMLRNQLNAVADERGGAPREGWREDLTAEIEAMDSDSRRVPWQDGLPEPIAASFEPFRARLAPTYSATVNPFELSRNRKNGLSIQAE